MDMKEIEIELIKKRLQRAKEKSEKEKVEELMRALRMIYPLFADTKGKEILETYTELKENKDAVEKTEKLIKELLKLDL